MKDIKTKPAEGGKNISTKAGGDAQAGNQNAGQTGKKTVAQGRDQLAPKEREGRNAPNPTKSRALPDVKPLVQSKHRSPPAGNHHPRHTTRCAPKTSRRRALRRAATDAGKGRHNRQGGGSTYGIFFVAEPTGDGISVQEAVAQFNDEYRDRPEEITATVQHDRQEIQSNDGSYAIAWQDVLTVFSSRVSGAADGASVAVLDEARLGQLREILWDMNEIDYSTRTETHEVPLPDDDYDEDEPEATQAPEDEETPDEPRTTITETALVFALTHRTPEEMALAYACTSRQQQYLELLADPQNDGLWLELLGNFSSGGDILIPGKDWSGDGPLQWPLPIAGQYHLAV